MSYTGLEFDVYAAADPNGAKLATLDNLATWSVRLDLVGPGSGQFSLALADADPDIIAKSNLVRVRMPSLSEDPIFAFWIEAGDFELLSETEDSGQTVTFGGAGALAYLNRGRWWSAAYGTRDDYPDESTDTGTVLGAQPADGIYYFSDATTGTKPGQILARIIAELRSGNRPQQPCPDLTTDITYSLDSDSHAWSSSDLTADFQANIGDEPLELVKRLMATEAIVVQMGPELALSAYNDYGRDQSASVVFEQGVNLLAPLSRSVSRSAEPTHQLVAGQANLYGTASAAGSIIQEAFASSELGDQTALDADASQRLVLARRRGEPLAGAVIPGTDPDNGLYCPGPPDTSGDFWLGDTVTINAGPANDFGVDTTARVYALTFSNREAEVASSTLPTLDFDLVVEFSASIGEAATPGGGSDEPRPSPTIPRGTIGSVTPFASTIRPVLLVDAMPTLPAVGYPPGQLIYLTEDDGDYLGQQVYQNDDGTWVCTTDGTKVIQTLGWLIVGAIQAGAIGADEIAAGAITADKLAALLIIAGKIATAESGCRVEIDRDGVRLISADDTLLVNLPTNGDSAYFNGDIQANSLTLIGDGELRGDVTVSKDGSITLGAGTQPPNAAPVLSQGLPTPITLEATTGWLICARGYYDANGGSDGSTACYVTIERKQNGASYDYRASEFKLSDGSLDRTTTLFSHATAIGYAITRKGANWYLVIKDDTAATSTIDEYARATGTATGDSLSIISRFYLAQYTATAISTDGTYLYVVGAATNGLTMRICKFSTGSLTYVSTQGLTLPSAPPGATDVFARGMATTDDGDGNGTRHVISLDWQTSAPQIYEFTTAGAVIANIDWPSAQTSGGKGVFWDGTNWREVKTGPPYYVYTFSNGWTTSAASLVMWISYGWYNSTNPYETTVGPRASVTMSKRRWLTVTTAPIPTGGADDPDKCRVYMVNGAADPGPTNYKLQVTDALTVRTLSSYNSGGAADPATNDFPGGTGAKFQSADGDTEFDGDGTVVLGGVTVSDAGATPVFPLESYYNNLGGDVTLTSAGTYYQGPNVSLTAGTWLVVGHVQVHDGGNGYVYGRIWDGSTAYASDQVNPGTGYGIISLSAIVTIASTKTVEISCTGAGSNGKMYKAMATYGQGDNASGIAAVRLA